MQRRIFAAITTLALAIIDIHAQTHAEATSQKWQGIKLDTVLTATPAETDKYYDDNTIEHGCPFLLYNVGTGCFITQGGDWAMEGRLFFRDFGRTMYLYSNGRINGAIQETTSPNKNSFCARPPEPTGKNWTDTQYAEANYTTLFDGSVLWDNYPMMWYFERVPGETGDTYTYYMYQKSSKQYSINPKTSNYTKYEGVNFYLGAAWGECHNTSVGKGDGRFVFMDDDRSCWTTADVRGNTNKLPLENGDEVEIQKLYQWKLISVEEFIRVLNDDGVGLNPSISSLIKDRDFTRNSNDFFDTDDWTTSTLASDSHTYGTKGRYCYTWGDYKKSQNIQSNNQQKRNVVTNENWDAPVKLKSVFDRYITSTEDCSIFEDSYAKGKKNAKFGFMTFEGVGTVYTNFEAPKPGWYELSSAGFSMSEQNHDAYMFARVIANEDVNKKENTFPILNRDTTSYGKVTLKKLPFGTYTKESYESCLEVGKELLYNVDQYRQKVWVQVSQDDWDAGRKTIRVGYGKNEATQSEQRSYTKDGKTSYGYYDTDWVCVDDIRASFMGLAPAFFYEDEEDLTYLSHDPNYRDNFESNEYVPTTLDGRYGGSASLQRTFTVGEWNTFSFPLPMTGEQVRNAFSQDVQNDCELLVMNKVIDSSVRSDCVIDFTTVDLMTTENVIEPGKFYLLKATKNPSIGENPRGEMANYYDLGKMFFSTNASDAENPEYKHPVIDLSVVKGHTAFGSETGNPGTEWVTYVQTPSYSKFRVNSSGIVIRTSTNKYDLGIVDETYATKGSYVLSKGKMYELKRDTPLKGFRGWITLTKSIFPNQTEAAAGAKFAIDGVIDGEDPIATSIDRNLAQPVNVRAIAGVYDLMGRKVGDTIENLPKGLYIVSGKKLLVK